MGTTVQVLKELAAEIEGTAGSYQEPNVQLPFTSFTVKQTFDLIEDASIVGVAFADLPLQGVRHVIESLSGQGDVDTLDVILEAAIGNATSPYDCPTTKNEKTLSLCGVDEVKTYKYAGVVLNNFILQSSAEGDLNYTADCIGWKAETRDDTGFPTPTTSPGARLVHQHAGTDNSGYVRIADQGDALDSGDNQCIGAMTCGINWNFGEQFCNNAGPLQLLSASAGRPDATFTFQISRHDADTFLAARDARTALQAELLYYAAAAAQVKVQIPNFIIEDLTITEDDIPMLDVTCRVARNGTGTNYSNSNMSFVTPIRYTVTNS